MRKPDFFIVGAPKCGTTALYRYLKGHPEIFMSEVKEPHFFCVDLDPPHACRDEGRYLSLFAAGEDRKRVGEASATYLYSRAAASKIQALCPSSSIIIMLRNPIDVMYSLHSQRIYNTTEEIVHFEAALAAEQDRREGSAKAKGVFYLYRDAARFSEQVRRYMDLWDRDRIHIILFDDLKADPAKEYVRTLGFLGVSDRFQPDFKTFNPHRRVRSPVLHRLLKAHLPMAHTLADAFAFRKVFRPVFRALLQLNSQVVPREPMDPGLRMRLQREFSREVEDLGRLVGRDLTHWSRPQRGAAC